LYVGDSAVYVLAITKQKSYLERINKTAFDNLSTMYDHYLSKPDLLNRNYYAFTDISHQLYELIFHNLTLPAGRIIISPDVRYFPFESLVTRKPDSYFVEDFAVSYTYSARYLLNDFSSNSSTTSGTLFGVAPVRYANGIAALPGSDQSLQRIQRLFKSTTNLIGAKATKGNFLNEYYRYKIVQVYSHATDSGSSGNPEIYFADSALSLSDLFYENEPASSLIVLSACQTAEGKVQSGEGVFSFNRQFAALGVPSCISTLWEADNKSMYKITELFYKYLTKGFPMDVALQSAKREILQKSGRENKMPYYWAAPILVGQSGTIDLPGKLPWLWTTTAAIFALIGIGGWRAKKRRMQRTKG
jgi:CHAT domain-containing protein